MVVLRVSPPCWFFETLKSVCFVGACSGVADKGQERKGVAERGHGHTASAGCLPGSAVRRSVFRSRVLGLRFRSWPGGSARRGLGWISVLSGWRRVSPGSAGFGRDLRGRHFGRAGGDRFSGYGCWIALVLRLIGLCFREAKGRRRHGSPVSAGECRAFEWRKDFGVEEFSQSSRCWANQGGSGNPLRCRSRVPFGGWRGGQREPRASGRWGGEVTDLRVGRVAERQP